MARIKVKQIEVGQELQKDAISSKGRLLLTAGTKLEQKHIEILRTWGVTKVDIIGDGPVEEQISNDFNNLPADIKEQISEDLKIQFRHCNPEHPFIKELITYQRNRSVHDYLMGNRI